MDICRSSVKRSFARRHRSVFLLPFSAPPTEAIFKGDILRCKAVLSHKCTNSEMQKRLVHLCLECKSGALVCSYERYVWYYCLSVSGLGLLETVGQPPHPEHSEEDQCAHVWGAACLGSPNLAEEYYSETVSSLLSELHNVCIIFFSVKFFSLSSRVALDIYVHHKNKFQ